jgi:hypothetical protein
MLTNSLRLSGTRLMQTISILLLTFNLFGVLVYLKRASISWAVPQEQGLQVTTGEPFIWAAAILPIIAVFFLVNLIWGGFIVINRKRWRSRLWFLVVIIWFVAITIDFMHH